MKTRFPTIMVALAIFFLVTGSMVLCECPGWFGMAALFGGLAIPKGTLKVRICAFVVCATAVTVAVGQIVQIKRQQAARERLIEQARDKQAK